MEIARRVGGVVWRVDIKGEAYDEDQDSRKSATSHTKW